MGTRLSCEQTYDLHEIIQWSNKCEYLRGIGGLARCAWVEHEASTRTRDVARELYRTYVWVSIKNPVDRCLFCVDAN